MKNNDKMFEVRCGINHNKKEVLFLPYSVHADFNKTISSNDDTLMAKLVELFAEFSELEVPKKMTFQALIEENADDLYTIDDLLRLLKAVRLCTAFHKN